MAFSLSPLSPLPTPTGGPPVVITTPSSSTVGSTSDPQSSNPQSSTTSSSSSSYSSATATSSSSSSQTGLSSGARAGLALGISELTLYEPFTPNVDSIPVFFLILSVLLFYNLKRRLQRAREKVDDEPALAMSEVRQDLPPQSVAPRGRNPPPPPRLDTTYLASADISSAVPLLSYNSNRNSYAISAQNRYSTLSQATDPQRIAIQEASTLPNPYDPFPAPARPASYYSPTYSIPHGTSASAAMMATSNAPAVGSPSNPQSEGQLSALHADMTRHQKELEHEHKKRSLDQAQEPQEPPPQYPS
ncbi:hypothetical protein CY34DRAFT_107291 [Suillus luteus UH-Slu-Lm8-n1]|uniref:Uncharacterized protein n=1 Tax=Suillus luteus UH-Slu-Lm8-n1 TaxID=930992 RepID=A0A0C9ZUK3_9AGAM|nr:hypothetical protein CY34DRAFT_107291 [Suillus luteus UH-Slu-Lm8-n1]